MTRPTPLAQPVGRFAPSPTGQLHFGSLLAALASYLDCRHRDGSWLLRVEDIDPPREVPGSADQILADLAAFGMTSTAPVIYQSERHEAYRVALKQLLASGQAFYCGCSRSDLASNGMYPGTCRNGVPAGRTPRSIRLRVTEELISFRDRVQGPISDNLEASGGDFVIQRADGLPAYQLAVVVDDHFQGVTEVVRGADLLRSTARQIYLQRCLGISTPEYAHIPLALGKDGKKLSKRNDSDPVSKEDRLETLRLALETLGQALPDRETIASTLQQAILQWDISRIPDSFADESSIMAARSQGQ